MISGTINLARILSAIKKRGLLQVMKIGFECAFSPFTPALHYAENKYIDLKYNIDTYSKDSVDALLIDSVNKRYSDIYKTIPERVFRKCIRVLPQDLSNFHFIDLGSGKGRILFLAAQRNFKKISGIEFSHTLFEISQKNKTRYEKRFKNENRIELIFGDVTQRLHLEDSQPYVLFFFNPFRGEITESVVETISKWRENNENIPLYAIWYNCHPMKTDVDPLFRVDWLVSVDGISSLDERPHGPRYVVFKSK